MVRSYSVWIFRANIEYIFFMIPLQKHVSSPSYTGQSPCSNDISSPPPPKKKMYFFFSPKKKKKKACINSKCLGEVLKKTKKRVSFNNLSAELTKKLCDFWHFKYFKDFSCSCPVVSKIFLFFWSFFVIIIFHDSYGSTYLSVFYWTEKSLNPQRFLWFFRVDM